MTVTESLAEHPGFSLTAAACPLNSYPPADTGTPTNPQSIAQIQRNQDWFCTFNNVFTPNSPSIATMLVPVGPVAIGAPVLDTAVLTGATATAGGTVTYTAYTNNTARPVRSRRGPRRSPTVWCPNSDPITFPTAGTFFWQAVYSGDANNLAATSVCTSETLVVNPNAPSIATMLVPVGPVAIGTPVFDTAVLTGATATAGGTVTYTAYTNNTCTTGAIPAGTKTVTNGVVPEFESGHVPHGGDVLLAGGVFGGRQQHRCDERVHDRGAGREHEFAVDFATLLVPVGPVAIGTPVFDTAVLTRRDRDRGWDGDLHRVHEQHLHDRRDPGGDQDRHQRCGTRIRIRSRSPPRGRSSGKRCTRGTPTTRATSVCTTETLVVNPNSPSIATLLVPVGPVAIGAPVFDTAVLTGATATAGGTVTYTAYTNNTCTTNPVSAGTVTVTNGVVPQSNPVTFPTAGTFFWQAVYSGDANNLCDQRVHVRDPGREPECAVDRDAVGAGGAGGDRRPGVRHGGVDRGDRDRGWDGDLHRVHQQHLHGTGAIPAGTVTVTNGVVPQSNPVTFPTAGTFFWQAVYSGDANNLTATSVCTSETLVVNPNAPSIATLLVPVGPVAIGAPVFDTRC